MKNPTCFIAGTMILTVSGLVAIENIKAGDKVISTNPETFETAEKAVLETYIREVPQLVHLAINGELISTTVDHPFYVKDYEFVNAGELYIGDKLLDLKGNTLLVEDTKVEKLDETVKVYNFQVEDFHTYHVGKNNILVHNAENYNNVPVKDKTKAPNGLDYQSNAKHTPGMEGNGPQAGIEPRNSLELFSKSIASTNKPLQRYTFDKLTGTLHRFFNDGNGCWHWSGSTNQGANSLTSQQVPIDIIRLFDLPKKGW